MKLASIENITEIKSHPNADKLEIAHVLNYDCIVVKDSFKIGDWVVLIQCDTVLPDAPWSAVFKAKSNRVKAIRLRQCWSEGIVLKMSDVLLPGFVVNEGMEVSSLIGVTKYEPPIPQDLNAKGILPFGIPVTDEERYQNIVPLPLGEIVDVTLKRDGKSWTGYAVKKNGEWFTGICGRRFEYRLEFSNDYTKFKDTLGPLLAYAQQMDKSIAIRGEITGQGIQSHKNNPHCTGRPVLSLFSTYLVDEHRYSSEKDFDFRFLAAKVGVDSVETLEYQVPLTMELIKKYAEDLTQLDGKPFEGVVIKRGNGQSFKVINKDFDSKK